MVSGAPPTALENLEDQVPLTPDRTHNRITSPRAGHRVPSPELVDCRLTARAALAAREGRRVPVWGRIGNEPFRASSLGVIHPMRVTNSHLVWVTRRVGTKSAFRKHTIETKSLTIWSVASRLAMLHGALCMVNGVRWLACFVHGAVPLAQSEHEGAQVKSSRSVLWAGWNGFGQGEALRGTSAARRGTSPIIRKCVMVGFACFEVTVWSCVTQATICGVLAHALLNYGLVMIWIGDTVARTRLGYIKGLACALRSDSKFLMCLSHLSRIRFGDSMTGWVVAGGRHAEASSVTFFSRNDVVLGEAFKGIAAA
ncbi:hypothetical protein TanjilG_18623 [Lupinus angustifolius]|uniref:Uncharacterized protein n=1 Tax=Lupinus angustifolius TaxID=3871 RepID=A0A1J7IPB9_LUPAN|nr:hypothetical protein TanjilG_18623 [Lupinus angustifolius]